MAVKKPNFLANLWAKGKSVITKGVTLAGNAAGALIGIPTLGTLAGNLLDKIPVQKMAEKAVEAGKVDQAKVAETLVKNNIPATATNVATLTTQIQAVAAADPSNPTTAINPLPVSTGSLPIGKKISLFFNKYWYVGVVLVGGVLFFVVKLVKRK